MTCAPAARADVDRLAVLPVSATVPSAADPDLNVTVPVGLPPVVTVAVNVTICPKLEGFRLEATVVLLGFLLTTCFTGVETLAANSLSPAYVTVMLWVPAISVEGF